MKSGLTPSQRLFSPYVQTEIGRRQGGKGSGLGLALVRQIVRLSNGRLGVDSEYGKGSVFWFELPYAIPAPKKKKNQTININSPHLIRPPLLPGVSTIDEESVISPAMEKDDPLDRIECRGSEGMPLTPRPPPGDQSGGAGDASVSGQGQGGFEGSGNGHGNGHGQERPKLKETESTMPLLSRTSSGRIRRESGMFYFSLFHTVHIPSIGPSGSCLPSFNLAFLVFSVHSRRAARKARREGERVWRERERRNQMKKTS